jgi:hypothetical protein
MRSLHRIGHLASRSLPVDKILLTRKELPSRSLLWWATNPQHSVQYTVSSTSCAVDRTQPHATLVHQSSFPPGFQVIDLWVGRRLRIWSFRLDSAVRSTRRFRDLLGMSAQGTRDDRGTETRGSGRMQLYNKSTYSRQCFAARFVFFDCWSGERHQ